MNNDIIKKTSAIIRIGGIAIKKRREISLFEIVMSISDAMDLINPMVNGHHKRVAYIALMLAEGMDLSKERIQKLVFAGALHDIGAFSLKERINALNFEIGPRAKKHAEIGYLILKDFKYFNEIANIIKFHHTDWSDEDLTVEAGILRLADRIDVLVNPEKEILSQRKKTVDKVKEDKGNKFMPEAVEAFEKIAEKEFFWFELISVDSDNNLELISKKADIKLDSDDFYKLAELFSKIIDFRSNFTATHSAGVATVARNISLLAGFSKEDAVEIEIAGYLHDLGKLAVPISLINKEKKLKNKEYNVIKQHPFYTYKILKRINNLDKIRDWASFHHEKIDGSGYPFQLVDQEINKGARILAIADIFTALSENRPYRSGLERKVVLEILDDMADNNKIDADLLGLVKFNYSSLQDLREITQQEKKQEYKNLLVK